MARLLPGHNLDSIEPEPYILTKQEEEQVVEHETARLKNHLGWKLRKFAPKEEVDHRLEKIDWSKYPKLDIPGALARANSNKHRLVWEAEQRVKDKEEEAAKLAEINEFWTAGRMLQYLRGVSSQVYGKELIENEHTKPLIKVLCLFLSRSPKLETETFFNGNGEPVHYEAHKGLLIRGISGLGKTYVPECLAGNERNPITLLSMIAITEHVRREGVFRPPPSNILYLDDVGTEQTPVKYFGTQVEWFKDFFELVSKDASSFNRLIISTNLDFDAIQAKYGFRVRSRIKEVFNIIDVSGTDLRK